MSRITYGLSGGLSSDQLEKINEKMIETLETVGMDVSNPKILEFIKNKPGFNVIGNNVRFSKGLIRQCIETQRTAGKKRVNTPISEKKWILNILSGYPLYKVDYDSYKIVPFLENDAVKYSKLVDVLYERGVRGSVPGAPQDIDPLIRDLRIYQLGAKHCRCGGMTGNVPGPEVAEWMYRLFDLMGQPKNLGVFVINPLKAEGDTFDTLYEFRDEIKAVLVGSMAQMGVSSPVSLFGTFVISIAAAWGSFALVNALTGLESMYFFCRPWPTHMKTLDIVYGSPEAAFGELIYRQLGEFYGWPDDDSYSMHSSAPIADMQAGYQRGAYTMMSALNGDRSFRFGGLLGVDFVFSPEMLLLDLEALEYIKRVANGIDFDDDSFMMDAIREVGPSGSFLEHESTFEQFKNHLWDPQYFVHESVDKFLNDGARTAFDRVHSDVDALIAKHNYHLDENIERELDNLCNQAYKALSK